MSLEHLLPSWYPSQSQPILSLSSRTSGALRPSLDWLPHTFLFGLAPKLPAWFIPDIGSSIFSRLSLRTFSNPMQDMSFFSSYALLGRGGWGTDYLTRWISLLVSESQLPHKIVNLICDWVIVNNELTILKGFDFLDLINKYVLRDKNFKPTTRNPRLETRTADERSAAVRVYPWE